MYRRSRKYQQLIERTAREKAVREKRRMEGHHPDYPPELPELRRLIVVTDYDTGIPLTHQLVLFRRNRNDCYNVWIDGKLWKERIGWSKIFEGLRKALPRRQSYGLARIRWTG